MKNISQHKTNLPNFFPRRNKLYFMTYLQNLREVQYPKLPEPVPIHSKKLSPELLPNQTQTVQLFLF